VEEWTDKREEWWKSERIRERNEWKSGQIRERNGGRVNV